MDKASKTILIVDDDENIGNLIAECLYKESYSVLRAYSGTEAELLLADNKCDLILLDLMLPGLSGEELMEKISDTPVIIVSARIDVESKVNMLFNGACDYVTKPFEIDELMARIALRLKEAENKNDNSVIIRSDDIILNTSEHRAFICEKEINLTRTEFAILKLLLKRPNQVLTKVVILDEIYEDTPDCTEGSLKTHISNLRGKMRDASGRDYIEAVWGIGFKLNV